MVGLLVIAFYRAKTPEQDVNLFKRIWGVGVIGFILSTLADFVPGIAGPFALLALLGSLTNGGDKAIQNFLGGVSSKLPAAGSAGSRASTTIAGRNTSGTSSVATQAYNTANPPRFSEIPGANPSQPLNPSTLPGKPGSTPSVTTQ